MYITAPLTVGHGVSYVQDGYATTH